MTWVVKYPLKVFNVNLPLEIVELIIQHCLSDYKWEEVIKSNVNMINILHLKVVNKHINKIFNDWDNHYWFLLRHNTSLFKLNRNDIIKYSKNIWHDFTINWDLGYHPLVDYEIFYEIKIYHDHGVKIKYKGKEYNCPYVEKVNKGLYTISNNILKEEYKEDYEMNLPNIGDIMYVADIPINFINHHKITTITNHHKHGNLFREARIFL